MKQFVTENVARVSSLVRSLVSPRVTKLIEAGLLTRELEVTAAGREAIHTIAVQEWGEELEAEADAIIKSRE